MKTNSQTTVAAVYGMHDYRCPAGNLQRRSENERGAQTVNGSGYVAT